MSDSKKSEGVVYLLHFERPFRHARHYIGFCNSYNGLDSRMEFHAKGRGSKLLAAVSAAGINFEIVRIWKGSRTDERNLKKRKRSKLYCPHCVETPLNRRWQEEIPV